MNYFNYFGFVYINNNKLYSIIIISINTNRGEWMCAILHNVYTNINWMPWNELNNNIHIWVNLNLKWYNIECTFWKKKKILYLYSNYKFYRNTTIYAISS